MVKSKYPKTCKNALCHPVFSAASNRKQFWLIKTQKEFDQTVLVSSKTYWKNSKPARGLGPSILPQIKSQNDMRTSSLPISSVRHGSWHNDYVHCLETVAAVNISTNFSKFPHVLGEAMVYLGIVSSHLIGLTALIYRR